MVAAPAGALACESRMRLRRALLGVLSLVLLGAVGFIFFSRQPALPVMQQPSAASFDRALVAKGAELALIGNCNVCHTKQDGAPYAGTPAQDAIRHDLMPATLSTRCQYGHWVLVGDGLLAGHARGRAARRAHLYPAFPYDHFTKASVGDLRALYAFLMTRELRAGRKHPTTSCPSLV